MEAGTSGSRPPARLSADKARAMLNIWMSNQTGDDDEPSVLSESDDSDKGSSSGEDYHSDSDSDVCNESGRGSETVVSASNVV